MPVFATTEALDKLIFAVDQEGLSVQPEFSEDMLELPKSSFFHLQQTWRFIDDFNIQTLRNEETSTAVGKSYKELRSEIPTIMLRAGTTPSSVIDILGILVFLRAAAIKYEELTQQFFGGPQQQVYELGIVTMESLNGASSCDAQLFRTTDDVAATNTIWIYHSRISDANGEIKERCSSIGMYAGPVDIASNALTDVQQAPSVTGKRKRIDSSLDDVLNDMPDNMIDNASTATPVRKKRNAPRRRPKPNDLVNATPDEVLAADPDLVVKYALLRAARFYSNTEIFNRLNETLRTMNREELKHVNHIARRISVALDIAASNGGKRKKELRNELTEARKTNGVPARMKLHCKAIKENNKAHKPGVVLEEMNEEEGLSVGGEGLFDDDGRLFDDNGGLFEEDRVLFAEDRRLFAEDVV